jgi:hypothetical protein
MLLWPSRSTPLLSRFHLYTPKATSVPHHTFNRILDSPDPALQSIDPHSLSPSTDLLAPSSSTAAQSPWPSPVSPTLSDSLHPSIPSAPSHGTRRKGPTAFSSLWGQDLGHDCSTLLLFLLELLLCLGVPSSSSSACARESFRERRASSSTSSSSRLKLGHAFLHTRRVS